MELSAYRAGFREQLVDRNAELPGDRSHSAANYRGNGTLAKVVAVPARGASRLGTPGDRASAGVRTLQTSRSSGSNVHGTRKCI